MLFGLSTQKIARVLSYCVAAVLISLPFYEFFVVLVGSHIKHLDLLRVCKEIVICLLFVPTLWLALKNRPARVWLAKSKIVKLFVLYVLLHLIIGLWALSHHRVIGVAFIYALVINLRFIGFFILCALIAAMDDFLIRNWLKLVLAPAAVAIAFGLLQRAVLPYDFLKHFGYGPSTVPAYDTIDANLKYRRIESTLRGANPFGAYLVLVITAGLAGLKGKNLKPLYLLAGFSALFFTYSRSAWLGLLVALIFLIRLATKRWAPRLNYIALAGVVVLAIGLYGFRNHQGVQDALLHTSKNSPSHISSNDVRSSAIRNALNDVYHQPLGSGPGTAGPASLRNFGQTARIAENYYLQIAQEVGLLGLAIFLAINVAVVRRLWAIRDRLLAQVLLASFAGICFINLLSHAWADDTLSLLWWGLAGISLAPAIISVKNK